MLAVNQSAAASTAQGPTTADFPLSKAGVKSSSNCILTIDAQLTLLHRIVCCNAAELRASK